MPLVLCKEEAGPNHPGGSGPQRLETQSVPPSLSWHQQLSPCALPTPSSNAGPWGQGSGLPCTHLFP